MRSVSDSSWFSRGWGARALATAVLLVLMVFVAACDSSSDSTGETSASGETSGTAEGEPVSGGTLTFARALDAEAGLNPINAPNNGSIFMIQQIFDQLVEAEAGAEPVPGLAESWDTSRTVSSGPSICARRSSPTATR